MIKRKCKPTFELLEDRRLLACVVTLSGSTLRITGDREFDVVRVTQIDNPAKPELMVKCNTEDEVFFDSSLVKSIVVDLKGGNDKFDFYLDPDWDYVNGKSFKINLGAGRLNEVNFELDLFASKAIRADLIATITGSQAVDDVAINITSVVNARVDIRTDLNDGDDLFFARLNGDPANHSSNDKALGDLSGTASVNILANGGIGRDRMFFEAGNDTYFQNQDVQNWVPVRIGLNASLTGTLNGGEWNDPYVGMRFRGVIYGSLRYRGNGDAGVDQLLSSVVLDDRNAPSTGTLDSVINGGADNDVVKSYFRNQRTHDDILNPIEVPVSLALVNLVLDGSSGRDGFYTGGNTIGRPFIVKRNVEYVATIPPLIF